MIKHRFSLCIYCGEFVGDMTATWSYDLPCDIRGRVLEDRPENGLETGTSCVIVDDAACVYYDVIDSAGLQGTFRYYSDAKEKSDALSAFYAECGDEVSSEVQVFAHAEGKDIFLFEEVYSVGTPALY